MGEQRAGALKNVALAALVLGGMCALPTCASVAVSVALLGTAYAFGGATALSYAYAYLAGNPAVFGVVVYAAMAAPTLAWYYVSTTRQGRGLREVAPPEGISLRDVAALLLVAVGLQGLVTGIMQGFQAVAPWAFEEYADLVSSSGMTDYSLAWLVGTAVLPPLVEEASFRGLGLGYLRRAGAPFWLANLAQAVMFGVFHGNLVQGVYAAALGLVLGLLVYRYGSIVAPMAVHAAFNVLGTLGNDAVGLLPPVVQDVVPLAEFALFCVMMAVLFRPGRPPIRRP